MTSAGLRVRSQLPDLDHGWIAFAPRDWPPAPRHEPWLDLARGRFGEPGRGEPPTELAGGPFEDTVYLPPVEPGFAAERDALADRLAAPGTPVYLQLCLGGVPPRVPGTVLWDPTSALLQGEFAALSAVPVGAQVLWPLVPGITDGAETVTAGCARLAKAGAAVVHAVEPSLTPGERRQLAEAQGEAAFDRLFHGPAPDLRSFARSAHRVGLAVFLPRPLPRPPLAGAGNREVAAVVALAGELGERLGRSPMAVQALLRAARWLDRSHHDVRALAREGHLGLLEHLDTGSREIVSEWAAAGRSTHLEAALAEYLGGDDGEIGVSSPGEVTAP